MRDVARRASAVSFTSMFHVQDSDGLLGIVDLVQNTVIPPLSHASPVLLPRVSCSRMALDWKPTP